MGERTQIFPSLLLILLELVSIIFYGVFTEYHVDANILINHPGIEADTRRANTVTIARSDRIYKLYWCFQDIHVMMFSDDFFEEILVFALGMNFWLAACIDLAMVYTC